jgi:hypothetical protein
MLNNQCSRGRETTPKGMPMAGNTEGTEGHGKDAR